MGARLSSRFAAAKQSRASSSSRRVASRREGEVAGSQQPSRAGPAGVGAGRGAGASRREGEVAKQSSRAGPAGVGAGRGAGASGRQWFQKFRIQTKFQFLSFCDVCVAAWLVLRGLINLPKRRRFGKFRIQKTAYASHVTVYSFIFLIILFFISVSHFHKHLRPSLAPLPATAASKFMGSKISLKPSNSGFMGSIDPIDPIVDPPLTAAADAAGVTQSSKGTILSTFYYGYACSQVPGGFAAQRIGGRWVLFLSFVSWSLTYAFVPLDPNRVTMMVLARFLVGVAQGFMFPSIHSVLAQWVPPNERSRSVSLTTSGMYLGAALGMLVIPSLVRLRSPQDVFLAEATLGTIWSVLWLNYASDPSQSELPKATSNGFGEVMLLIKGGHQKIKVEDEGNSIGTAKIPWTSIFKSFPVWAIVVNNFTFHYALYVMMNWLPTYFQQGLQLSLQEMGTYKMVPYLNMFIFSNIGGVFADHWITKRLLSVTTTRKLLNTVGFIVASLALMALPGFKTSSGAIICSSVALGFLALGRAGFAVNHMDIAPRYAGIVMGVSNTAGTLAGIIGVDLTGKLLEAAKSAHSDLSNPESWRSVFMIPGVLCIFSSLGFLLFSTGERIFD